MLESIFTKLLILSVQAGFIILATIVIRGLLKKIPKRVICLLWCMVALRLLIPVTIESPVSLIPTEKAIQNVFSVENENGIVLETEFWTEQISPNGNMATEVQEAPVYTGNTMAGVPGTDSNVETTYHYEEKGNNGLNVRMPVIMLWLLGTVLLLSYGVFTYVRVRFKVQDAVRLNDNMWLSDRIDTPFLLGYIKPRIYMPFFVDESRREYIIAHEMGHIKRGDHLTKLIGYILLCVYWFQPLVWIAYVLFCKDVEMACDEKVIGELGEEKKRAYSQTLLHCSVDKHYLLANPLAFGEIDVKKRISNVLSYKKPGVVISVISVILLAIVAVCFLTNGKEEIPQGTQLGEVENGTLLEQSSHFYNPETVYTQFDVEDYTVLLQAYVAQEEGPLEVAIRRGDSEQQILLLDEYWQRDPEKIRVQAFEDILGYEGFYVFDFGLFHTITTQYYAQVNGEIRQIALSFGDDPENNTFSKDLDGDGINELICNVFSSGDGRQSVRIYKREGDLIKWAYVDYGITDDWQNGNFGGTYYDVEKHQIVVEKWIEETQEPLLLYVDIDLSKLDFVDYVPGM